MSVRADTYNTSHEPPSRAAEFSHRLFYWLSVTALVLAFGVVVLGAYVRLNNAGLGCPDWPGCYGRVQVPAAPHAVARADRAYPNRPVQPAKAWKEMIHRYVAGTLGVLILIIALLAWRNRRAPNQPVGLPFALLLLVVFQALLGMWTVTLLLVPLVVMGHLLGGMTIVALLMLLVLCQSERPRRKQIFSSAWPRRIAGVGLVILAMQIALGGWTSSNYAAVACPDFPTCQGQWWPHMNFAAGFTPWRGLGIDYAGGVLHNSARMAIHYTHRLGALVTFVVLGALSLVLLIRSKDAILKALGGFLGLALLLQVGIGISMVELQFPLALADAHNGGAALLLIATVTVNYALWSQKRTPKTA